MDHYSILTYSVYSILGRGLVFRVVGSVRSILVNELRLTETESRDGFDA